MIANLNRQLRLLLASPLGGLTVLLWLAWLAPAAALDLKIAVQQGQSQVAVGSSTPAQILDGSGNLLGQLPSLQGYFATPANGAIDLADQQAYRLIIKPTEGGFVYVDNRWYRGSVALIYTSEGILAVNTVDLEDYIASVVGKEVSPSWPQEVLKAQAVAARSYALFRRQKRRNPLFDLGNDQTYQVYKGLEGEAPSTHAAVQATTGQVLTHGGAVIEALFHASSGGHTENSEQVYGSNTPYLRGVQDFDQTVGNNPYRQWSETFSATELQQKFPGLGRILALKPLDKTSTQRIKNLQVVGDQGTQTITGRKLRSALGSLKVKSTLFEIEPQGGLVASQSGSAPTAFQISGKGFGHGVGMSQWGALGMAQQGKSYREILQHYYQGTTLAEIE